MLSTVYVFCRILVCSHKLRVETIGATRRVRLCQGASLINDLDFEVDANVSRYNRVRQRKRPFVSQYKDESQLEYKVYMRLDYSTNTQTYEPADMNQSDV